MKLTEIPNSRLYNQHVLDSKFKTAGELVGWMGALQAQDYNMSKWAVGIRIPNSTESFIDAALEKGEIFRTHLLRPTWHLVAAKDIHWMLELTAPQVKVVIRSRFKELELNEKILSKTNSIIEKAVSGNKHLLKEEIVEKLEQAKIKTDDLRTMHILMHAELDGIICNGKVKNKKQTHTLLSEVVAKPKSISREEALAKLAHRYITSHGPATVKDFSWWSGLSITDSRKAIESVKKDFFSEVIKEEIYWFPNPSNSIIKSPTPLLLLSAFDEFIISYKDRSASIDQKHYSKVLTVNGIFRPIVVENGQVIAIWRKTTKNEKVSIEIESFKQLKKETKTKIEIASETYGKFLAKKIDITYK